MRFLSLFTAHPAPLTAMLALLLAAQAGCIPHYNNFDGEKDGADKDQLADGGHIDKRGGEAGLEIIPPDVSETDQHVCVNDVCVCQPDCAGKECGDDGCGGSCGTCGFAAKCESGQCIACIPNCSGKECGDNGCGGMCGLCPAGWTCKDDFMCGPCIPNCSGKECGENGCGGSCGACDKFVNSYCKSNGLCDCEPDTCAVLGKECGFWDDGCGGKTDCEECDAGLVWVSMPGGNYQMGCSPGDTACNSNEKPPHPVTVSSFEMLETEVTEGQYSAVIGGDPSCDDNGGGEADSPVECVDWFEAKAFCEALDPKGRLCTEAEWEYAARGGTTTKYYCGDSASCLADIAWYDANSNDGPGKHKHDVKGKDPNDYGLYDMLGNVWEWVEDCWHSDYDMNDDGEGDWDVGYPGWTTNCKGSNRVLRGGGFVNYDNYLRVSYRYYHAPLVDSGFLGFRCCRSE